jgi:hypothetical protein
MKIEYGNGTKLHMDHIQWYIQPYELGACLRTATPSKYRENLSQQAQQLATLGEGDVVLNIWNGIVLQSTVLKTMSTCKRPFGIFIFGTISRSTSSNISMAQTGVDIIRNVHKIGAGVKNGNLYHLKNREDAVALTSVKR